MCIRGDTKTNGMTGLNYYYYLISWHDLPKNKSSGYNLKFFSEENGYIQDLGCVWYCGYCCACGLKKVIL